MTEIGELVPIKNDFGDKLLSGDDEGAQVLGFWLWLFAPNLERTKNIIDLLAKGEEGYQSIRELRACEANYFCNFEVRGDSLFIFDDDLDGFPNRMMMLSPDQLNRVLGDYMRCLEVGLKNAEPFLFEYMADGIEAKSQYTKVLS
jgi:hypothetical protein